MLSARVSGAYHRLAHARGLDECRIRGSRRWPGSELCQALTRRDQAALRPQDLRPMAKWGDGLVQLHRPSAALVTPVDLAGSGSGIAARCVHGETGTYAGP